MEDSTILIVDDELRMRKLIKDFLSKEGCHTIEASNGEEAIEILKANKGNGLIMTMLLDLNMPKVDGFAVLEFMRQNGLLGEIPEIGRAHV